MAPSVNPAAGRFAFIVVCGALIFTTIAYGAVHQPIIAIFYLLVTLAAVPVAFEWARGRIALPGTPLLIPLVGAALYAFIQVVPFGSLAVHDSVGHIPRTISLDPFATWSTALHFVSITLFFVTTMSVLNSADRIRRLSVVIIVFGFGLAFFSILQSVLSPQKIYGIYEAVNGAPFGPFVNRNDFAAYIEMTIALPLGLAFAGAIAPDKRLIIIMAILVMGVALILSDSRGGLVSFIAQMTFLLYLTRETTTRRGLVIRGILAAVLVIGIIAGAVFVGGDTSLTRIAEMAASEDFSADRTHIWSVTLSVIAAHFPLGAGFGAFHVAYTQFDTLSGAGRVEQAHNDYLQVLADAGLPGLMFGLAFLFFYFRIGLKTLRVSNTFRRGVALGAFVGCFGILVHSIFDFVLHITAIALLFVALLSMVVAARNEFPDDFVHRSRHNPCRESSDA